MKKFVLNFFLALPVICMLSSFSSGHDGGDIIQVPQMKQEPSHASHLTDDGYFDGLLYYKITSNSTNEVAVVKSESSAIDVTIPSQVIIDGKTYTCTRINDNAFKELKRMTSVTIPNSVTYIGERAFSGCRGLTSIIIPNSVTSIGGYAFEGCSGLTSVHISDLNAWCRIVFVNSASNPLSKAVHLYLNGKEIMNLVIPNSVTYIGSYAFSGCSELASVTIPNSVTSIGSGAFDNCSSLTSVTIPSSVTSIGGGAFYNCSSLTSVTIPNSVTSIGDVAFYGCSGLTSITIPNGVTSIGIYTFYGCSGLTSVTIPIGVTFIGESAFQSCSSLSSIIIPHGVTSIGYQAFFGCSSLTSVTIPNSVTSIGWDAFYGCSNIKEVVSLIENPFYIDCFNDNVFRNSTLYVPVGTLNNYKSTEGWEEFVHIMENFSQGKVSEGISYIYDKRTHTLTISGHGPMKTDEIAPWHSFINEIQNAIIESGVTSIGEYAFESCNRLNSVTIPNSVKCIERYAFHWCSSLTSVTIPNSVTSIDYNAFEGCSGLTSVTIPESVKFIDEYAFAYCSGLTSIIIPNNVTSIGNSAFACCSGLTSIIIPNNVTSIGNSAFHGCSSLTSITIPNSVSSIGGNPFSGCYGLNSILVESGNQKYDSRNNCNAVIETSSSSLIAGCMNTIIPNSVTSIGERAFFGSSLTSVTIPNSVTSIGDVAFYGCSGLTSITIPNSVTSIENGAFSGCSSLASIKVESDNSKYDSRDNCNAIIETSSNCLIAGCKSTIIPNSVKSIGDYAFFGCSRLASITIPNSVTTIGECAFAGCSDLDFVTIPNSVTSIGMDAFIACFGLSDYYVWAENVPSTNGYLFSGVSIEECTLHVPAASVEIYKQTYPWSGFGRIVPLTDEDPKPTGIKGIIQSDNLNDEYYDLTGHIVNNPKKGLYIKNGKKVVLK